MAPLKHSLFIIIWSIFIHQTASQLVVCSGVAGSSCSCPPAFAPGETCVLDCGRENMCQEHTLTCRSGDPCYVNCAGKASCTEGTYINSNGATDVTVRCENEDSCKTNIHIVCGSGDCTLQCVRMGSCVEFGWVDTRIARSWNCHGVFCPWSLIPLPYSLAPTPAPSQAPTQPPTKAPTSAPTFPPTNAPTESPTSAPTHSTSTPTTSPTTDPTTDPTSQPSVSPTTDPTTDPTWIPTYVPTTDPTFNPTDGPTKSPTDDPSTSPTPAPTRSPTNSPWDKPTTDPTIMPTVSPTDPSESPTISPTKEPTDNPTQDPTMDPTEPTNAPSESPTAYEAQAAQFMGSTGGLALITVLTICVCCCIVIIIALLFYKKYDQEKNRAQKAMAGINTPDTYTQQSNISPDTDGTRDTDMQVVDGMVTMPGPAIGANKLASVSELDLFVLHSLNAYNKQDKRKMAATNGGKVDGEDKDFQLDPNLISAFMYGGGAETNENGEEQQGATRNPFSDGFEEETGGNDNRDDYNGNFVNPFADLIDGDNDGDNNGNDPDMDGNGNEEPIELQEANSIDEMGVLEQRMKLMRLLQQQYELMNGYNNMEPQEPEAAYSVGGQGQTDPPPPPQPEEHNHNVDMGLL